MKGGLKAKWKSSIMVYALVNYFLQFQERGFISELSPQLPEKRVLLVNNGICLLWS